MKKHCQSPAGRSRRQFLKNAAWVAAPMIVPAAVLGKGGATAPSERITFGIIGCGGRGLADMDSLINVVGTQAVAVCDVDALHYGKHEGRQGNPGGRDAAKQRVEQHYSKQKGSDFKGCDAYADYHEICAREDIDAMIVATPDHWHALCVLEALRKGKDIYCEKPVTHWFAEGQAVVAAVAKHDAIFQTGSQQRSDKIFRQGVELVQNGVLGKIQRVEVGLPQGHSEPQADATVKDPPASLDYEMWTGPSQMMPYMKARNHWHWRWHTNYGGGQLMDWIGHHNDIAHWGMDMDKSGPSKVEALGWTFPKTDVYDSPVDYEVRCEYAGGITTSIGSVNPMGCKWTGENGWIHVTRGAITASNPEWLVEGFSAGDKKVYDSPNHYSNFIDGIKTRDECVAPAATAHRSITPGHIAYVSQKVGRSIQWDPAAEKVIGDDAAQKLLMALPWRDGYELG